LADDVDALRLQLFQVRQFVDHGYSRKNTKNDLMDGLRAVFERITVSQRLLLFRRPARSKKSNDMTGG
ncbi:hypothetical protein J8J17_27415, partial [Mycobacterium tuberculosis]|nr:hypothetical protein [Mycobacterium tuberculosis]